jgi:hypothetical protein
MGPQVRPFLVVAPQLRSESPVRSNVKAICYDSRERDLGRRHLLIQQLGTTAEIEAARRAEAMLKRGDHYGQRLWVEIRRAILGL